MKTFQVRVTEEAEAELLKTLSDAEVTPEVLAALIVARAADHERIDWGYLRAGISVERIEVPKTKAIVTDDLEGLYYHIEEVAATDGKTPVYVLDMLGVHDDIIIVSGTPIALAFAAEELEEGEYDE